MTNKHTPDEILALYNALPTKAAYTAIKAAYDDLEKTYGDFVMNTLGYPSIEAALEEGREIVNDLGRHPDDCYRAELLQEVILKHTDE